MQIELIAFESMGVRSQATFVQTKDVTLLIDASAALAPRRYGLPPHKREVLKLFEVFDKIEDRLRDVEYVIVTHYHYDHHDPARFINPDLYRGKVFIIKDPQNNINVSQKIRAHRFLKILQDRVAQILIADGNAIEIGNTRIMFSKPVPHGENSRLGYVVEVCIDDGEMRFLFTSDVEGAPLPEQLEFIKLCRPNIVVIDGAPTYLVGYKYSWESFQRSMDSLRYIVSLNSVEVVIYDHHVARELNYIDRFREIVELARSLGKRVINAAEYMGYEPTFLEALRRELFETEPEDGLELLKEKRISVEDLGE